MDNLEFANICRVCLSTNNLTNLQEVGYIIGLFRNITNIQIESFDELPQNICNQCIEKLDSISNFITLSKQNDTFLRQALLNNTRIKTELDLNADTNQNKSEETDEKYNNEVYIKTEPESESQYENECDNLDFKISERDLSKSEPEFTEEADSSDEVCFIEKKQIEGKYVDNLKRRRERNRVAAAKLRRNYQRAKHHLDQTVSMLERRNAFLKKRVNELYETKRYYIVTLSKLSI